MPLYSAGSINLHITMPLQLFFFCVLCYHEALRSCIKTISKEVLEKGEYLIPFFSLLHLFFTPVMLSVNDVPFEHFLTL